jgi:hypothetical protein
MQIVKLVSMLPPDQRAHATRKIKAALHLQWGFIACWYEAGFEPHHRDLVGVHPVDGFDFLPEPPPEKQK